MSKTSLPKIHGELAQDLYASLIEEYLLTLFQEGYSVLTLRHYGWHLHQLGKWLVDRGISKPCETNRSNMRRWGAELREKYQPRTQKQAIAAARSFFQWLVAEEICSSNPASVLRTPRIKITSQRTLSLSEVSRLIEACPDSPKGARDKAIIALLVDTGLRAGELCNIQLGDIDFDRKRISIIGKGGNSESVYFSDDCEDYLLRWLDDRDAIASAGETALFVSAGGNTPGHKLTPRGLRSIVKKIGDKIEIENVTPHAFRRAFATIRLKLGQSTRGVQELGRWRDLKTFERYTLALQEDIDFYRNNANQFSPLKATKE